MRRTITFEAFCNASGYGVRLTIDNHLFRTHTGQLNAAEDAYICLVDALETAYGMDLYENPREYDDILEYMLTARNVIGQLALMHRRMLI